MKLNRRLWLLLLCKNNKQILIINQFTFNIKIMMYNGYHLWGMHIIWWFIWIILLIWIFATPYDIPGQKNKKDAPLDLLQKRFASGQITTEEYQEKKIILQKDVESN